MRNNHISTEPPNLRHVSFRQPEKAAPTTPVQAPISLTESTFDPKYRANPEAVPVLHTGMRNNRRPGMQPGFIDLSILRDVIKGKKNPLLALNKPLTSPVGAFVVQGLGTLAVTGGFLALGKVIAGITYNSLFGSQLILAGVSLGFFVTTSVVRKIYSAVNRMLLTNSPKHASTQDVKRYSYLKQLISDRIDFDAETSKNPEAGNNLKELLFTDHYPENKSDLPEPETPQPISDNIDTWKDRFTLRGLWYRIFSTDNNVAGNLKKPIQDRIKLYDEIMRHHFGILKQDEPVGQATLQSDLVKLVKTYGGKSKDVDMTDVPEKDKEDNILNGFRYRFKIIALARYASLASTVSLAVLGTYNWLTHLGVLGKAPFVGVEFVNGLHSVLNKLNFLF